MLALVLNNDTTQMKAGCLMKPNMLYVSRLKYISVMFLVPKPVISVLTYYTDAVRHIYRKNLQPKEQTKLLCRF